jgi:hypothetical protein
MKVIKINESQKNRLFEAYQEGFSLKELSMIADSAFANEDNSVPQMEYCRRWLGYPDSMGSSRCVFTLNDNLVLKLAYGRRYEAGIDQNLQEYTLFQVVDSPLLARVFNYDKNFTFLVSEAVLPCTEEDFEKILGIPFYHFYHQNSVQSSDDFSRNNGDKKIGFNKYFDNIKKPNEMSELSMTDILMYIEANYVLGEEYYDKNCQDAINKSQWLQEFIKLVIDTKMSDFVQLANFGIVNRDGNPTIVVLDSGLNLDVWEKHYKS